MGSRGRVREWHDEHGWGVIDSPAAPGGCWAHFSAIEMDGYRALAIGDEVDVDVESADQDGYAYRAVAVRRLADATPEPNRRSATADDPAFGSWAILSMDDDAR